jgi:hypothetical protein
VSAARFAVGLALGVALGACNTEPPPAPAFEPEPAPPTTTPPAPPPPSTTTVTAPVTTIDGLEAHEWGLVDVPLSGARGDVSAVPTCAAETTRRPSPSGPPSYGIARPRAPLIYFHLAEGHAPVDLTVHVALPGGAITETWPLAAALGETIAWHATVRPEHCAGSSYPPASDAPCGDARCEASELGAYEADGTACVRVGDADFADLFYAGGVPLTLPVTITHEGDAVTIVNDTEELFATQTFFVHRGARREDTRIGAAFTLPHAALTLHADIPIVQVQVSPFDALVPLGMTETEAAAFRRAWSCALFGDAHDGTPCASEEQPEDAVLFWMPRTHLDALAPLTIEPSPEQVSRALLVRVDLAR